MLYTKAKVYGTRTLELLASFKVLAY